METNFPLSQQTNFLSPRLLSSPKLQSSPFLCRAAQLSQATKGFFTSSKQVHYSRKHISLENVKSFQRERALASRKFFVTSSISLFPTERAACTSFILNSM